MRKLSLCLMMVFLLASCITPTRYSAYKSGMSQDQFNRDNYECMNTWHISWVRPVRFVLRTVYEKLRQDMEDKK